MQLPPKEIRDEGFYRAGIRCAQMLVTNPRTNRVKIVLYTVLEENDLEQEIGGLGKMITYIRKDSDLTPLIAALQQVKRKGD